VIPTVEDSSGGPPRALLGMMRAVHSVRADVEFTVAFAALGDGSDFERSVRDVATPVAFSQLGRGAFAISPALLRWLHHHVTEFDLVHIHAFRHPTSDLACVISARKRVPYILRPLGTLS